MRRLLFASVITLAICHAGHAAAQMPEGWRDLPAEDFLRTVTGAIGAGGQDFEGRAEVDQHAWSNFLTDAEFIERGDWPTAVSLVGIFGESSQHADKNHELLSRMASRIRLDSSVSAGVDLFDFGEQVTSMSPAGFTPLDVADAFAAWMDTNDWGLMDLAHHYNLYKWVSADTLDQRRFSARWTGTITAPRDQLYTFRQVRQHGGEGSRLLVTVDGKPVIDSRDASAGETRFIGEPIRLDAGRATPIRVEMTHDVNRIRFGEGVPIVALTWSAGDGPEQVIPSSAFQPAGDGGAEGPTNGLYGEYFSGLDFDQPTISRVDPCLGMAWSWPPTAPRHHEKAAAVLDRCVTRMLDRSYLLAKLDEGDEEVFSFLLWRIVYQMDLRQREQLVQLLRDESRLLAYLTPQMIGRLSEGIHFLPGSSMVDLIGEWSLAKPHVKCQAGWYPGWGEGSYQKLNLDFYWLIGFMMQGPYEPDGQRLCDDYLVLPNGECNLRVAYITSFAGHKRVMRETLLERIEGELADDSLAGDQRVTWLIAKAFAASVSSGQGRPEPLRGMQHLEEAMLVADSDAYRRWVVEEMVHRLSACGQCDAAEGVLERHSGLFASDAAADYSRCQDSIESLRQRYDEKAAADRAAANSAYQAEVDRRRKRTGAGARTDAATASR